MKYSDKAKELIVRTRKRARNRSVFYTTFFWAATALFPILESLYLGINFSDEKLKWIYDNTWWSKIGWEYTGYAYLAVLVSLHLVFVLFLALAGREDIVEQALSLVECEDDRNSLEKQRLQSRNNIASMLQFLYVCGGLNQNYGVVWWPWGYGKVGA